MAENIIVTVRLGLLSSLSARGAICVYQYS
jgi:hypothetical protein